MAKNKQRFSNEINDDFGLQWWALDEEIQQSLKLTSSSCEVTTGEYPSMDDDLATSLASGSKCNDTNGTHQKSDSEEDVPNYVNSIPTKQEDVLQALTTLYEFYYKHDVEDDYINHLKKLELSAKKALRKIKEETVTDSLQEAPEESANNSSDEDTDENKPK